jgi:hypothetical protein
VIVQIAELDPDHITYPEFAGFESVELRVGETHLHFRGLNGVWENFVALADLVTPGGIFGSDVDPIVLQTFNGCIQWKSPEMLYWNNIRGE